MAVTKRQCSKQRKSDANGKLASLFMCLCFKALPGCRNEIFYGVLLPLGAEHSVPIFSGFYSRRCDRVRVLRGCMRRPCR